MGSVYKRKGRGGKVVRTYTIEYRDHTGRLRRESSRTTCKRTAQQIVREREDRVVGVLNGTVDLDAEHFQAVKYTALEAARESYLRDFATKGKRRGNGARSARSISDERYMLALFFQHRRAQGLQHVADLATPALRQAVDTVAEDWRGAGLAGVTVNKRVGAVQRFAAWCVKERLIRRSALERWERLATAPVRERRPLTYEEVERLLEVARERGRELWYLMALRSGLRRSELSRLTWGDVRLEEGAIWFPGSKSKSRRDAVLPIARDLLEVLRRERPADVLPSARVFPTIPTNTTRTKDFHRAKIPLVDAEGRHADLHSLRVTLGTTLARRGIAPQLTQEFMRHSDYRTTREFYVHLRVEDLAQAAAVLVQPAQKGEAEAESA